MAVQVTTPIRPPMTGPTNQTMDQPSGDDCSCGQALDCCHALHCPRCGVTLRAA